MPKEYDEKIQNFYQKYMFPNKKYVVSGMSGVFPSAGIFMKLLRDGKYRVYLQKGMTPPKQREKLYERAEESSNYNDIMFLLNDNDEIIAAIPAKLIYLLDQDLFHEKIKEGKILGDVKVNKDEAEKVMIDNGEYAFTDTVNTTMVDFLPLAIKLIEDHLQDFESYILVYFPSDNEITDDVEEMKKLLELPENIENMKPEERIQAMSNYPHTLVLIDKETGIPFMIPMALIVIFEPKLAKELIKKMPLKNAKQHIELLRESLL
jgi:hypothetical protein